MIYDFHTHSFYSDGVLSPIELIRRAHVAGYAAIGVTDHAGMSNLEEIAIHVRKDCELAERYWGIRAIPGVEITHVPAGYINECARHAKELGVRLVVVHGETPVEPVEPGTNRAAILSPYVDILAHPGLLSDEEAQLAAIHGVFLEITSRGGHSLTNGHVAALGIKYGVKLLVNSDSHQPGDLLKEDLIRKVAVGAGLPEEMLHTITRINPELVLQKIE